MKYIDDISVSLVKKAIANNKEILTYEMQDTLILIIRESIKLGYGMALAQMTHHLQQEEKILSGAVNVKS